MNSNDIIGLILLGLVLGVPILTGAFCVIAEVITDSIKKLKGN